MLLNSAYQSIKRFTIAQFRVKLSWVYNVVAVAASRSSFEDGRCIQIRNTQGCQVRYDRRGSRKVILLAKLNAIG
jgi:hypothetical protein